MSDPSTITAEEVDRYIACKELTKEIGKQESSARKGVEVLLDNSPESKVEGSLGYVSRTERKNRKFDQPAAEAVAKRDELVNPVVTLKLKDGKTLADVPSTLLAEMEKLFDVGKKYFITEDDAKSMLERGEINEAQYDEMFFISHSPVVTARASKTFNIGDAMRYVKLPQASGDQGASQAG